jgi:cephalosporin hydroxylase
VTDIQACLASATRQNAEGCVKVWEDLDRYYRVLRSVQPTLIIETGTFSGKSARWFARHAVRPRVVTVDTNDLSVDRDVREDWDTLPIHFIMGNSTDPDVIKVVRSWVNPHDRVMVVLDSDHAAKHVYAEMKAYGPMVSSGSYMVVEDTLLRWMPDAERANYEGDPLDAVGKWMRKHGDEWRVNVELESIYPVTQFPGGWLQRRSV